MGCKKKRDGTEKCEKEEKEDGGERKSRKIRNKGKRWRAKGHENKEETKPNGKEEEKKK